jgi:Tol biopolymer transport system component/DNA-binding CsgD family transcriptional regulator
MRRGRPPYPGILTPREQEVLDLLRQGLTNQQIADRLDIGLYGARYHVSEILSKLGVSSREEAAAWQAGGPTHRRWLLLAGPLQKLTWLSGYKLVGAGAIAACGLLALGLLVMGGGGTDAPADLGKLAYVQSGDIFTLDIPGGRPKRLTEDGDNFAPQWSPSGEWILFEKPVDRGFPEVWLMRADGSDARQIDGHSEQWSPVDDKLAYISGQGSLVVEYGDGSGRRVVVPFQARPGAAATTGLRDPLWSPNGASIAYGRGDGPLEQSIWSVEVASGATTELHAERTDPDTPSESSGPLQPAAWSLDGQAVYFWRAPVWSASIEADGWPLWVASIDGTGAYDIGVQTLVYSDYLAPVPDSGSLMVVRGGGRSSSMNKAVAVVGPEGLAAADLTDEATMAATSPVWSPDGATIAYVLQPSDQNFDAASVIQRRIWLMDGNGANPRRLNEIDTWQEWPQWSRDGTEILYVRPDPVAVVQGADDPRKAAIWLQDVAGGSESLVLPGLEYNVNTLETNIDYYGHLQWNRIFDWWQP